MIGNQIAHYIIRSKLGQGGMGEVYQATDTKLRREVALKVLPESFTQDPQRMARFTREAQVLASLSHPHIGAIHGIEEQDGVRALVLELIEGEDLSGIIARGPIPLEETLKIALQIAEALEAAHERGIIHRDLKPANIKIASDGSVKVLDFGLAKAMEGDATSEADLSQSPTLSLEATQAGVILGTAAYMSPEQARGKPVDKRTDIFAFGAVLFEMLSGRRAFDGEDITVVLASIIKSDPEIEKLAVDVPPRLRRLIGRCLQKDPRDRLHDIADARLVIQDIVLDDDTRTVSETRRGSSRWALALAALLGLITGVLGIAYFLSINSSPPGQSTPIQSELLIESEELSVHRWGINFALSPDGTQLVFRDSSPNGPLRLRNLTDRTEGVLRETEGANPRFPFFSPEGEWVGFFIDGKLKKVRLAGGKVDELCDATQAYGGTWGPDGTIVFNPSGQQSLWQVSAAGGTPEKVTELADGEGSHSNPVFLPDGSGILFAINNAGYPTDLALLNWETREYKVLLPDVTYALYAPTGHLVYARQDGLYAVPFDLGTHEVSGPEVPLIRDIRVTAFNFGQFALSATGALAYIPGIERPSELIRVDLNGDVIETLPAPPRRYAHPRLSPDGSKIAVQTQDPGRTRAWIVEADSERMTEIARDIRFSAPPFWMPNGERVLYISDAKTYSEKADGSGDRELLFDASASGSPWFLPVTWSLDGRLLIGWGRMTGPPGPRQGYTLLQLDPDNPSEARELIPIRDQNYHRSPALSPDGSWLAYTEGRVGQFEEPTQVLLMPYPEGGRRLQVSTGAGGDVPLWSPDGKQLFFSGHASPHLFVVDVQTTPDLSTSLPSRVLEFGGEGRIPRGAGFTYYPNWSVSPDGESFIMVRLVDETQWQPPTHFNVNTGFFQELREKVPSEN